MEERRPGKISKDSVIHGLYCLAVLVFLLVFFIGYRPLIVSNSDDWTYISFTRSAVPKAGLWNPAKVLPEILLPACAQIAVWFVLPVTGEYIWSISLVMGAVLSLLILLYVYQFDCLLIERFKLPLSYAVLTSALFLIFHFRVYMSPWIMSKHLFYAMDLNNCFNYTVPALINLTLVLMLERIRGSAQWAGENRLCQKGFLFVLLYLAIFSNLYSNCILAVYAGFHLLRGMAFAICKKEKLAAFLKNNALHLLILALWVICALFELTGGRAGWQAEGVTLLDRFKETIDVVLLMFERIDDTVFWLSVLMLAAGLVLLALSRGRAQEDREYALAVLEFLFMPAVILVYLMLLSSVVNPGHLSRTEVLIAVAAPAFMAAFVSLAYVLRKFRHAVMILPLLVFVIGFEVCYGIESFGSCYTGGHSIEKTIAIQQALVDQAVEADQQGLSEMTMNVPHMHSDDNFPFPEYLSVRIQPTLKRHGVIHHIEKINIEFDEDFYTRYGIY